MKLLIINPGSTSTKISLHDGENKLFEESIFHDAPELLKYPHVNDQVPFRKQVILDILEKHGYSLADVDVFVGRGGSACPCEAGVMQISQKLYEDTRDGVGGSEHAAKLGVMIAHEFSEETGKPAYTMNPTNVDELIEEARITGIKGVYYNAQAHVLNQKAVATYHAEKIGKSYENCNFIVCHIDGGITVHAHRKGRMIDGNVGSGGDGAFTPTRIGSVPILPLIQYLKSHSIEEVELMCSRAGGFVSHFGTSNADTIHQRIAEGDKKAALIWRAMIYQIAKQIGAMAVALEGEVDGILLTGGLIRFPEIAESIHKRCDWIAPIYCYPGEMEQEALASETLKVLHGKTKLKEYTGRPVWNGIEE